MFSSVKTACSLSRERKFEKRAVVGNQTGIYFLLRYIFKKEKKTHMYEKKRRGMLMLFNPLEMIDQCIYGIQMETDF